MTSDTAYLAALAERFWAKVERRGPDDCWPWMAYRGTKGHGYIKVHDVPTPAHRVVLMMAGVDIPPGCIVHHKCGHPWCVNPAHLTVMDHAAHTRLHNIRGCGKHGEREMARIQSGKWRGSRYCKACNREAQRERHRAARSV
jgi:hypothetical protein